jgi:hypothetical protein
MAAIVHKISSMVILNLPRHKIEGEAVLTASGCEWLRRQAFYENEVAK